MKGTKNPGNQVLSFRSRGLDAVSLATQFEKNKSFSGQCLTEMTRLPSWDRGRAPLQPPALTLPLGQPYEGYGFMKLRGRREKRRIWETFLDTA